MTVTTRNAPLWGRIGELAARWLQRHEPELLVSEYSTRRVANSALADQLAAQFDLTLCAEKERTASAAAVAFTALVECEHLTNVVPGVPAQSWHEEQDRLRNISAARKNWPDIDAAHREAQAAHERAVAAYEAAINAPCRPYHVAASRAVPEAERAAQQLIRDAREDLRWAGVLPGLVHDAIVRRWRETQ